MSVFVDLDIRLKLNTHLYTLGTEIGDNGKSRQLDLSVYNFPAFTTADVFISEGERAESMPQDRSWIEHFLVKSPQRIYTPAGCGISRKAYQYGIWVKTPLEYGPAYNEMVAGLIEEHFPNNMHIPLDNGDTLTVLKTYQQATVVTDSDSGRMFNRVFIDCENYFKNNNK